MPCPVTWMRHCSEIHRRLEFSLKHQPPLCMNGFLMHIGHTNVIDVDYTIKRQRSAREILDKLPSGAPERSFFESDRPFLTAFPDRLFHCWGIPQKALPAFRRTEIGDLILFIPSIGVHDGGVTHIGIVKAICRTPAWHASRILWPETPDARLFPWLFFFEAERGFRDWHSFLTDMHYNSRWNPRGWYRRIDDQHFSAYSSGVRGYLDFIRREGHFVPTGRSA